MRRVTINWKPFSNSNLESDSQATFYIKAVRKFVRSDKSFRKFRKNYDYAEILEHVSPRLGEKYLERINILAPNLLENFSAYKINDTVGDPFTFAFKSVGKVSPTTIRYVAVASELLSKFGSDLGRDIAEIGVGYGGQASILAQVFKFKKVTFFDLPEVLTLSKKYLNRIGFGNEIEFSSLDKVSDNRQWDFVISNYAFSELPKALQIEYLNKVIIKSKKGYMIMNSGKSNLTGRSGGKLSLEELRQYLPSIQIYEELPKTGPDNYVITWGF